MSVNFGSIMGSLGNIGATIATAKQAMDAFEEAGVVLQSENEGEVEAKIQELEEALGSLRQKAQDKLRGTSG
jgi:hypothetical protein